LDGALIFLAPAYTGISVRDYTSLFDTLYVSLYKYFNAASGAILAGPKEIIAPMDNTRRMLLFRAAAVVATKSGPAFMQMDLMKD
jgi:threonine aldolase